MRAEIEDPAMTLLTTSQHPGARVVVLSGNPRAGSRTTAAAVHVAQGNRAHQTLTSRRPIRIGISARRPRIAAARNEREKAFVTARSS